MDNIFKQQNEQFVLEQKLKCRKDQVLPKEKLQADVANPECLSVNELVELSNELAEEEPTDCKQSNYMLAGLQKEEINEVEDINQTSKAQDEMSSEPKHKDVEKTEMINVHRNAPIGFSAMGRKHGFSQPLIMQKVGQIVETMRQPYITYSDSDNDNDDDDEDTLSDAERFTPFGVKV